MRRLFGPIVNLSLLILLPVAWYSPLITAMSLPTWLYDAWYVPFWLIETSELTPTTFSLISTLRTLWETDPPLALVVATFSVVAPMLKCVSLAMVHAGVLSKRIETVLMALSKVAMADIFIIALLIVIQKGIGIGHIDVEWGLYLTMGTAVMSISLSLLSRQRA